MITRSLTQGCAQLDRKSLLAYSLVLLMTPLAGLADTQLPPIGSKPVILPAEELQKAPPVEPEAETIEASTVAPDPLPEVVSDLLARLRAELGRLERRKQLSSAPLGEMAGELEEARRDIERMAELLLRKEITGQRQQVEKDLAEQRVEALAFELGSTRMELELMARERDRADRQVADATTRIEDLASQLVDIDDQRRDLAKQLSGSREEAEQATKALAAADARVAEIDAEMKRLAARSSAAEKAYEKRVEEARSSMARLERALVDERERLAIEVAARDRDIETLEKRQERVRDALVTALAEIDATIEATASNDYEVELLRAADASSTARESVLDNMGFARDARGQLVPPRIDLVAAPDTIEPAAPPDDICPGLDRPIQRDYLDDGAAESWTHHLVGTIGFDEARTELDADHLANIGTCLETLSGSPSWYFKIVGHTDSLGSAAYNQELSLARAQVARDLFLAKVAIQPWRLLTQGRGEAYPLASNGDEAGRAVNRRVEVFAIKAPY